MNENFDDPKKHEFLSEGKNYDECQHCGEKLSAHTTVENSGHRSTKSDYSKGLEEVIDPRGDGPIEQLEIMEGGQPNIIDYSNQEPLLFAAGENSSHDYPGKIVVNNEPERVLGVNDFKVKKETIPGPAATGSESVGANRSQPTLPTGAPLELGEIEPDHNMHGLNFNHDIKWNETEGIFEVVSIPSSAVEQTTPGTDCENCKRTSNDEVIQSNEEHMQHPGPIEQIIEETKPNPMDGDLKEDIPASQAFSDTGAPGENDQRKLGKPFNEKSDTGDDLTRTGPGGNSSREDYDGIHYEGESSTILNAATGIELEENPKQIYDVSGVVPEYQETIVLEINDDFKTITLELKDESQEESSDELKPNDLKNHEGRKDSGTHTNTIKAGEKGIDKLLPISDIWKSNNDGMVETKQFSFFGDDTFEEAVQGFVHPSSWIGTVKWNPDTLDATVTMNGKTYNHSGVNGKDFESFRGSPSKGAHWNRFWKNQFNAGSMSEALNLTQKQQYEFDWINEDAIEEMKKYSKEHGAGKFFLAVVSGDSKTDHRSEGKDPHRRHWNREELIQNIRTGKGKMTDINHLWSKINPESGGVYDANWNFKTDRGEMILWETDQDVLDAIENDIITAVSINTGNPRQVDTACNTGECFIEPKGTILGEIDGVALAFVVTDPKGFDYNGQHIPAFPPGMQFTKLYAVE